MEKYTGNQEGFIYVSCRTSVQKEVLERYIEPLAHDGIKFYWANAFDGRAENYLRKSNALLLFLTKDFAGESKLRMIVDAATRYDKPILTVYLEDVELDPALSMQIEDITPLLELENLEYLSLACNPLSSIDGLEKLPNLRYLDISYTDVSEWPEGLKLRSLNADHSKLPKTPDFRKD